MITRVCVLSMLLLSVGSYEVNSYSQVATAGSGHQDGPKVYKALNMDLIFPKTFNSSENVISTTQTSAPPQPVVTEAVESLSSTADEQFTPESSSSETSAPVPPPSPAEREETVLANNYPTSFVTPNNQEENGSTSPPSATGRAVDYRPAYPFAQLLTPNSKGYNRPSVETYPLRSRPVSRPSTTSGQRVVYPSYQAPRIPSRAEIDKLSGKGQFSDRFTPSEAVASSAFKLTQTRNRKPSISRPVGQPSNKVSSFVPTKDLYTFPPNVNSRYPSPSDIKQASPSDTVTSYLPPAAGPLDTGKFVGPINPDLLQDNKGDAKDMPGPGYHYDPPQTPVDSSLDSPKNNGPPPPMDDGNMMDAGPPPPDPTDDSDIMDDSPPPPPPPDHNHDHDLHDHGHDHDDINSDYPYNIGGYADEKEYPTPPPGYLEEHGSPDHDFHHHHHHPDYDFSHGPYFHDHHHDHYPDVYDDYHDHHFHHDHIIEHHPEPEPMTTMAPPPPPPPAPEQPRVKKYSYFYIGRKLWYIPLYFTLWFTFYILWLILKSIARHKVNLPNHYVSRRSIEELNHREAREAIDKLTAKVMDGIETFKLKYIG